MVFTLNPASILGPEFYGFLLPWIFTFAIVYGLLSKIDLFGKDNKKSGKINVALAFVIAFFVTGVGGVCCLSAPALERRAAGCGELGDLADVARQPQRVGDCAQRQRSLCERHVHHYRRPQGARDCALQHANRAMVNAGQ